MKRHIKGLKGFTITATDGELGKVKDLYFDDKSWTIRYFVVQTGGWLFGRKVLIAPQAITRLDWSNETFVSNLTQQQVKTSPDINTEQPVSRQQEMELYKHYPWERYWAGGLWAGGVGTSGMMMPGPSPEEVPDPTEGDPHLRSIEKVTGYDIKAIDGPVGEVEDFIVDDGNWKIRYLVVDTGNWFPGKKVIISPNWINEINWESSDVVIKATVEQVKNSPEYETDEYLNDDYDRILTNYYGRFI
ncbi:PRC-barrel domain-containing protein [Niastella populi]|uniref:PRC-barrel domain-containing protein n=1 Tax=Niastella populi TaxID=550983 RepID=A0A1V9FBP7_9BACT|nr:PRC-barrel domain-containing protein [Niastella populi]OQP55785.1 hypothetical protein A4R26_27175 [Niastella populi]